MALRVPASRIQTLPPEAAWAALGSRPEGLGPAEVTRRRSEGANVTPRRNRPLVRRVLPHLTHLMAVLLWVGGALALLAGLPQLAIAIWLVNVINAAFTFHQEHRAERATEALMALMPTRVRVMRDHEETVLPADQLVPGDVVVLGEGDRAVADLRLVEAVSLRADQSALTGESEPVTKSADVTVGPGVPAVDAPNLLLGGCSVVSGAGRAVVFATGPDSAFGRIAGLTARTRTRPSPLQRELGRVTRVITLVAVAVGSAFFLLAVESTDMTPWEGMIFGLGMIVAFVPEGLLPTVTLALAMGTQRMAARQAVVKRLASVETLGSTTVICTDKTGTLTRNAMTVRHLRTADAHYAATGEGWAPEGRLLHRGRPVSPARHPDLQRLLVAGALCNDAHLLPPRGEHETWSALGDPTEAALLVAAAKGGLQPGALADRAHRLGEAPFEEHRRRMSTVHRLHTGRVLFLKGAPAEVFALCTRQLRRGEEVPWTPSDRRRWEGVADEEADRGYRVLALAQRTLGGEGPLGEVERLEQELCFLGLVAMHDPPRAQVHEAVDRCRRAGIRVVMFTGDHPRSARAIARRIGLGGDGEAVLTGSELDALSDEALEQALDATSVFARVTPEHKLRIVSALQRRGHVVAVTGDGVNDAPALKKADIGVAMGRSGTDVAREAADMVLLDDHFASIVAAVEEGRAVYANIRRFTSYIFTSNTPEAVPFIVFALTGGSVPLALGVMHILAVDLGTDLVPALALGAEPPDPGVMDRPPRRPEDHVITRRLLVRAYLWLGPIQAAAVMGAFFLQYWLAGWWGRVAGLPGSGPLYRSATAMALAAVVATQVGNLFAHRAGDTAAVRLRTRGNRWVWAGLASETLLILAIVYLPPLNALVGTAPFAASNWLFLLALTPLLFLADAAWRRLWGSRGARPRRTTRSRSSASPGGSRT